MASISLLLLLNQSLSLSHTHTHTHTVWVLDQSLQILFDPKLADTSRVGRFHQVSLPLSKAISK